MFTRIAILDKTEEGPVARTLPDLLADRRTLILEGQITSEKCVALAAALMLLEAEDAEANVRILINSPGGDAYAAVALVSAIKDVSCPVHTHCMGLAASAAALVLACGDRRTAFEHADVMIHQVLTGTGYTQQSNVAIAAEHAAAMRGKLDAILAAATGKSEDEIRTDTERDRWMSAAQAAAYGLVDEVIPFGAGKKEAR